MGRNIPNVWSYFSPWGVMSRNTIYSEGSRLLVISPHEGLWDQTQCRKSPFPRRYFSPWGVMRCGRNEPSSPARTGYFSPWGVMSAMRRILHSHLLSLFLPMRGYENNPQNLYNQQNYVISPHEGLWAVINDVFLCDKGVISPHEGLWGCVLYLTGIRRVVISPHEGLWDDESWWNSETGGSYFSPWGVMRW